MLATLSPDARLAALREEVRAIESAGRAAGRLAVPFGLDAVDRRLADGGLAVAALHEAAPATPALGDDAAATLFLAAAAARLAMSRSEGTVLWALARRDLFAPGLAQAGLAPERLIYAECRRDEEVLAVMEEGLRHGGLAAVVGEVGNMRLAAGRRLQLAAEEGGTTALMLRRWRRAGTDPLVSSSPAVTRWRIGCVPSERLAVPGIGRARWQVDLLRQRGGEPHMWILEAPDAEARLALPALAADRPDQAVGAERRAA
ncbi:ImuA family protein [Sphingosinicella sp. CPCC 101087]|uniref:ImuA family protein n=1 Tax=Sphingosinicella sp. CPCC 101087 TaxID=2497754 RepID=UPI00101BB049|nr:protein ImuA [Sphingosinicella sp. CPCC 101087]